METRVCYLVFSQPQTQLKSHGAATLVKPLFGRVWSRPNGSAGDSTTLTAVRDANPTSDGERLVDLLNRYFEGWGDEYQVRMAVPTQSVWIVLEPGHSRPGSTPSAVSPRHFRGGSDTGIAISTHGCWGTSGSRESSGVWGRRSLFSARPAKGSIAERWICGTTFPALRCSPSIDAWDCGLWARWVVGSFR